MATDSATKQYIHQQIAANLNLKDVTPQSKISQLVDGFLNEADNFENYGDTTLSNMFIETCSSAFLEKAGAQEGMSMKNLPLFRIDASTGLVCIERTANIPNTAKIKKGASVELTDNLWATFREEVDLSKLNYGDSEPISIDLEVSTINYSNDSISLIGDSSFGLGLGLEGYSLKIKTDVILPITEETTEEFRARLLFSKYNSKYGSEAAVKLAVASSSFVSDYNIDYTTTPFQVQLFSRNMLTTDNYSSYIESYAIPVIESQLLARKSAGASFKLTTPARVSFNIVLKALVENPATVPTILFSFVDYIEKTYKVGTEITYGVESIKAFLTSNGVDTQFLTDYKVIFNRSYYTYSYASEDNSVTVFENEYPFLESITLE